MRVRLGALAALLLSLLAGCGGGSGQEASVPKSITLSQVSALPLEEAGDLSIRQNLAERPGSPILGHDDPLTTAFR